MSTLDRALEGSRPEIFNTDQGSQYTSNNFTGRLKRDGIRISMDDRGRRFDNIMIERLWRSVKYEEVYLKDYASVWECREALDTYFTFYNNPDSTLKNPLLRLDNPDHYNRGVSYCSARCRAGLRRLVFL